MRVSWEVKEVDGCCISWDSWEDPEHERRWREEKKDSESPNYSYFPLPAKMTDGASYTHTFTASAGSWRRAARYFGSSGKMTTRCSFALKPWLFSSSFYKRTLSHTILNGTAKCRAVPALPLELTVQLQSGQGAPRFLRWGGTQIKNIFLNLRCCTRVTTRRPYHTVPFCCLMLSV